MKEPSKKLELKRYLKEREYVLQKKIIEKTRIKEDATKEMLILAEIQNIINICESRNRY